MSQEHYQRVKALFMEAEDVPPQEREGFLRSRCGHESGLLSELLELLRESEVEPADADRPRLLGERVGDHVGPYRLMESVGEGGFGHVWVAQQDRPVRRLVAVKILKPGMDTRSVIARFEAERQALAMMEHPNIARVFDAGATPAGRPYFAMELVRGSTVTDFCAARGLGLEARLRLMIDVARAVQHAHTKGVIHRDIKPGNILVSDHDGTAVVKVIDFGIAKAVGGASLPLTDKTLYTEMRSMLGTPAYMSPEQAGRSDLDIDTRSDIFALGVLLYELLVGRTPLDPTALATASIERVQKAIREEEPTRPSTAATTVRSRLSPVNPDRALPPPSSLRGELDWIAMKCLEKDRDRRYQSAGALADDLQRFLLREPVLAGPPGTLYRLQKLVQRRKGLVTAVAAVVCTAAIGMGATVWGLVDARRKGEIATQQASRAVAQRERADAVRLFLTEVLTSGDAEQGRGGTSQMTVMQALDQAEARLEKDQLSMTPGVRASVHQAIGQAYRAAGSLDKAALHLGVTLAYADAHPGDTDIDTLNLVNSLGYLKLQQGAPGEAEAYMRRSLALQRSRNGERHADVATAMNNLAGVLSEADAAKQSEALELYQQALAMRRQLLGENHPHTIMSLNNLGFSMYHLGRKAEAADLFSASLRAQQASPTPDKAGLALATANVAFMLDEAGRTDEAAEKFAAAEALTLEVFGPRHLRLASVMNNHATLLAHQGRLDQSVEKASAALRIRRESYAPGTPALADAVYTCAGAMLRAGRTRDALALHREALSLRRAHAGPAANQARLADSLEAVGRLEIELGDNAAGESLLKEGAQTREAAGARKP